jgi:hypothetical protein
MAHGSAGITRSAQAHGSRRRHHTGVVDTTQESQTPHKSGRSHTRVGADTTQRVDAGTRELAQAPQATRHTRTGVAQPSRHTHRSRTTMSAPAQPCRQRTTKSTHLECKIFRISPASIKIFCISPASIQNILHLAAPQSKSFAFRRS